MKNKIIIDFEFNGLYRYNFVPEVTQVKMKNLSNGKTICINFKTKNTGYAREFYGIYNGQVEFNKKWLELMLKKITGSTKDLFYGFSIETDKKILSEYGIVLQNYFDIQDRMRLSKKYEHKMCYAGSSLELCYFLITGEVIDGEHNSVKEINYIEKIYKKVYIGRPMKHLTMFPWGEFAGMPLYKYCVQERRRADGYRFNNNNALSDALNYYIDILDEDYYLSY